MYITVTTRRALDRQEGEAQQGALKGPVFGTDRSRHMHILSPIKGWPRIADKGASVAPPRELLSADAVIAGTLKRLGRKSWT